VAQDNAQLSPSLEDYLEAIYGLKLQSQVARVKDIAGTMGVKMPSVTEAIRSLASKGLVEHRPYESVELTEDGLSRAREIAHCHSAVKDFLVTVLGLDEQDAETEACGIEHAIRPDTLDKLIKFADFVRASVEERSLRLNHFQHYMRHGFYPSECGIHPADGQGHSHRHCGGRTPSAIASTKLSDLRPGDKGRIAFVSGSGPIRRRLIEMGLTSDTPVEVVRVAPLGDPMELKLRGYCLSLRRSEAERVEVEMADR
jgi:DtxR family transcriptional regulator, Mn-dependent transcriptional regulator